MVKRDVMKDFYDYNREEVPLLPNLPGFPARGSLTEDLELVSGTVGRAEGASALIGAAFSAPQIAVVGESSVEKLNRLIWAVL